MSRMSSADEALFRRQQSAAAPSYTAPTAPAGTSGFPAPPPRRERSRINLPPPPPQRRNRAFSVDHPLAYVERRQHVIFVHGTNSATAGERWAAPAGNLAQAMREHFGASSYEAFDWSGSSAESGRQRAATDLLDRIRHAQQELPTHDMNIVAHSHGGNVVARALSEMGPNESVRSVMTMGTPQFRKQAEVYAPSREQSNTLWGPQAQSHVRDEIVNVYTRNDYVQTKGAGFVNRMNVVRTAGDGVNSRTHSGRRLIPASSATVTNVDATNVATSRVAKAHGSYHEAETFKAISNHIKSGYKGSTLSRRGSVVLPTKLPPGGMAPPPPPT